ncbi:MAG: hypothetical protein QE271_06270 [Bacteriovoracaceae bacterium]|nr:hypothetical protein [Bacteriovoracaceae bacterium]
MKKEYDFKKLKKRPGRVKVDTEASKTPISIRLNNTDLSLIRSEAERLGLPYQTLVGSILHRYANGELIDKSMVALIKKLKSA